MSEIEIEIQAENAPPERPSWLPSNFEKPEDLAKSYEHATRKITEQGQTLSQLQAQIEEIQASQTTQQAQTYQSDIEQQLYDAYESGDGRAIAAANAFLIKQAVDQQSAALAAKNTPHTIPTEFTVDYAERTVMGEYPDWPEYAAKAKEIITSDPLLSNAIASQQSSPSAVAATLRTAYKLAKFESGQTAQSQAAQTLDELNRQVKNSAQTLSGGSTSDEAQSAWDAIKAARSGIPRFG